MIEQLEQICFAVGAVRDSDAEKVVQTVNQKLAALLGAHIVKLYWRQEAERGVILRPIAYINDSSAPDPQPFSVDPRATGVLEWVYARTEPLWLENIRSCHRDETIPNLCTGVAIETKRLGFADPPQSDAMIVVPIRERGEVLGLYSVELPTSRDLSRQIVRLIERLARSLGTALYNADVFAYDMQKSGRAISAFVTAVQGFQFDRVMLEQNYRTTFVARPYAEEFLRVQEVLERMLARRGIRARHYEAENRQYIVNEIADQIRTSHFCVADLTGNNLNVVAEVGMMLVLNKKPLVVRRRGDASALPFDLSQFSFWEYELGDDDEDLRVHSPAAGGLVPFDDVLDRFLRELPPESGYFMAEKWLPDGEGADAGSDAAPVATP